MITDVTAPRSSGGGSGSGGMIDTSCVKAGLSVTAGPINGMAKPPNWANRLLGGPLIRSIDRLDRLLSVPVGQCVSRRDQRGVGRELDVVAFIVGRPWGTRHEISNVPSSLTTRSSLVITCAVSPTARSAS